MMNTTPQWGLLQQWCCSFDKRLTKLADKLMFPPSRDGFCAISAYLTFKALQPLNRYVDSPVAFKRAQPLSALGVEASHCWVEVEDYCIDFTVGQFTRHNTYNKVAVESFVFESKRCYQQRLRSWHVARHPAKSLTLSGIPLLLKDWPDFQLPYNESIIRRFTRQPHFNFHVKREHRLQ